MEYRKIDFLCGWTIERAVRELHERAKDGNKYCGDFHENKLTSDMSLDDAYMLCVGKPFEQFNKEQEERRQRLIREDIAETHTFQQSSNFGVFEGTVTIIEKKE